MRGFKRLRARFFGIDVEPRVTVYDAAVRYKLGQVADLVDRPGVDAKLVRRGLAVQAVEGQSGRKLDRPAAAAAIVQALAGFEREGSITLPVKEVDAKVSAADLADARQRATVALSAPLRLAYGETRWRVPRWRIAPLLNLPEGGSTEVTIGGRGAEQYLEKLSETVSRKPQDAHFQVASTGKIVIRPSEPGLQLDLAATAKAIAAAAFSTDSAHGEPRRAGGAAGPDDREGAVDGDPGRRLLVHDDVRRARPGASTTSSSSRSSSTAP